MCLGSNWTVVFVDHFDIWHAPIAWNYNQKNHIEHKNGFLSDFVHSTVHYETVAHVHKGYYRHISSLPYTWLHTNTCLTWTRFRFTPEVTRSFYIYVTTHNWTSPCCGQAQQTRTLVRHREKGRARGREGGTMRERERDKTHWNGHDSTGHNATHRQGR